VIDAYPSNQQIAEWVGISEDELTIKKQ